MRLWSLHPKYLDPKGLVALWREALLAQKVLDGKTKGYKMHPQLNRFKKHQDPMMAIGVYLHHVYLEAKSRGYKFDSRKILKLSAKSKKSSMLVTHGQMDYEFNHLKNKIKLRHPVIFSQLKNLEKISPHPLFKKVRGEVEDWEIV